jgi:hypothetical protein
VPREQRREECTKALKLTNARQWLAAPGRENAPAPVKVLMHSQSYLQLFTAVIKLAVNSAHLYLAVIQDVGRVSISETGREIWKLYTCE